MDLNSLELQISSEPSPRLNLYLTIATIKYF